MFVHEGRWISSVPVRECRSEVCIRHTFQEENQRVNRVLSSRNHCRLNINGLRIKKISVPETRYDTSFWWEFDHGTNKSLARFVSDKQSEPSSDWIFRRWRIPSVIHRIESRIRWKTQLQLMNIQCRGLVSTCSINLTTSSNHFGWLEIDYGALLFTHVFEIDRRLPWRWR